MIINKEKLKLLNKNEKVLNMSNEGDMKVIKIALNDMTEEEKTKLLKLYK